MIAASRQQHGPRANRPGRLSSINNVHRGGHLPANQLSPARTAAPTPVPAPAAPAAAPKPAKKTCCNNQSLTDNEDGRMVCENCGQVVAYNSLTSELTFGENAAGGATVVGGFIGDHQRFANTMGGPVRGLGSNMESRQKSAANGQTWINSLKGDLNIPDRIADHAAGLYTIALGHNFVQGRRISHVAAVAIYLAARKQPENTLLLIDLSEKVHANVWELGRTYKEFCKVLYETDPGQISGNRTVQEIEPLMLKFCRKLEFGDYSMRVAGDACKLLTSMKRDWMVQGRNPAGLCGACIIMAARMNNFRRTIREVVYVVKVADTTISQRLYEYKRTKSSTLTVDQFRRFGHRMKPSAQPPAVWKREEKAKRAEKRKAGSDGESEEDSSEFNGNVRDSAQSTSRYTKQPATRTSKRQKISKDRAKAAPQDNDLQAGVAEANMAAITKLSGVRADNQDNAVIEPDETTKPKPKRGRRKKTTPIVIPDDELEIEHDLEREIVGTIEDWQSTFKDFDRISDHPILVRAGERARELTEQNMPAKAVNDSEEIGSTEFDDDPDVKTCILSTPEVRLKELVWNAENEEWLREQQKKIFEKEYAEAQGKPEKPIRRRKRHQVGDGSLLNGEAAATAEDATMALMERHGGKKAFSSHVNYERLKAMFSDGQSSPTEASTPEGSATTGASPPAQETTRQATPTPAKVVETVDVEDDEEYEEEEEVAPQYDDEDLENEHNYDDDEGFANDNYDDNY